MKVKLRTYKKKSLTKSRRAREYIFAYAMLAPDVIGLAIFVFLPVLLAFYVSLHQWNALEPMKYIGFRNYRTLLTDTSWWESVKTTIKYSLMFVPLVYCISLLLAVFINSIPGKIQQFFRTMYFVPFSISTVVVAIIWMFMFDQKRGYLNAIARFLGMKPQTFIANPHQSLFWIAFVSAWMLIGYYTIIFIAALKDIPESYYEAARIDGANFLRIFKNITFPLLREVRTFVLIITTILSFQVFDQIKIMTNGGPANATNVSVFYIYKQSFEYMKLGYASSMAFVLFLIIFCFSAIQLKMQKKFND